MSRHIAVVVLKMVLLQDVPCFSVNIKILVLNILNISITSINICISCYVSAFISRLQRFIQDSYYDMKGM